MPHPGSVARCYQMRRRHSQPDVLDCSERQLFFLGCSVMVDDDKRAVSPDAFCEGRDVYIIYSFERLGLPTSVGRGGTTIA
jgi:hypothetical protein